MNKVYIAGCGGMLGEAFHRRFAGRGDARCTDIDLNADWLSYCDVRDLDAYRRDVTDFSPDVLLHLAALTDLEYCEQHRDEAYLTNAIGTENAVLIANQMDIPVVYISTAGIFDGRQEQYDDWDRPNPLGAYARSKYAGELYVVEHARRYLVCRAGWMMGGGPAKDKKFINKLLQQLGAGRRTLHVVNDKFGTPTYTHDFAANVALLLEKEIWGLYNMVCRGLTDRLEVTRELLAHLGLADIVRVEEVGSDFFAQTFFAPRPESERLINRRLELRGLNIMRDWRIALREYLDNDFSEVAAGLRGASPRKSAD